MEGQSLTSQGGNWMRMTVRGSQRQNSRLPRKDQYLLESANNNKGKYAPRSTRTERGTYFVGEISSKYVAMPYVCSSEASCLSVPSISRPCSLITLSQNLELTWLPHWPTLRWTISRISVDVFVVTIKVYWGTYSFLRVKRVPFVVQFSHLFPHHWKQAQELSKTVGWN